MIKLPFNFPFNLKIVIGVVIAASVVIGVVAGRAFWPGGEVLPGVPSIFPIAGNSTGGQNDTGGKTGGNNSGTPAKSEVTKFTSKEDFLAYLSEGQKGENNFGLGSGIGMDSGMANLSAPMALQERSATTGIGGGGGETADRFSQTNVQVAGVDEPDVVKTDGKELYFSPQTFYPYYYEELTPMEQTVPGTVMPPYQQSSGIRLIKAFPPADLGKDSSLDQSGEMLLSKNYLVVLAQNNQSIYGYDVSDSKAPKEKWKMESYTGSNSRVITARLYQGKVYVVMGTYADYSNPCPINILRSGDKNIVVPCADIYHPVAPTTVDTTYTILILDPSSGEVQKKLSFVGSQSNSVVYMSPTAIYLTYAYTNDLFGYLYNFLKDKASDLVPAALVEKLKKVQGYDLSDATKLSEFMIQLQNYYNTLGQDDRKRIDNEFTNRMNDYAKEHIRDVGRTGIAKIGLDQLAIDATGDIPGMLINQFALDEYNGNLRTATTVGGAGGIFGFGGGNSTSANDVYVLDSKLKTIGSVKDLGVTERIYSVRFVGDQGYVVTFRQIDPFYVLNLSDPKSPKLAGELKIPGYSSYLDPLKENRILGIGQEGSQVKLSLFDTSSASEPKEAAKYNLSEYWSDVANNHHAFLADRDKQIFFLPAGGSGYIFSYKDDKLQLVKAVSNLNAKRAIYINDYLYVIGDQKIVVLNEKDWTEVKHLEL